MNDKELLELAAKAAGIQICNTWLSDEGRAWSSIWAKDFNGAPTTKLWNPLGNDGDAFRLSVVLQISVMSNIIRYEASTIALTLAGIFIKECMLSKSADVAARRAIVRAAAELGRLKP